MMDQWSRRGYSSLLRVINSRQNMGAGTESTILNNIIGLKDRRVAVAENFLVGKQL